MKVKEALSVIDKGWVKKAKGYRVHFQQNENDEWRTAYVPDTESDPLDSDVVAWRLAWKLAQASDSSGGEPYMADIYVVDDVGSKIKYYATNEYQVFCPIPKK